VTFSLWLLDKNAGARRCERATVCGGDTKNGMKNRRPLRIIFIPAGTVVFLMFCHLFQSLCSWRCVVCERAPGVLEEDHLVDGNQCKLLLGAHETPFLFKAK
jgi:hypothetical protein